MTLYLDTEFDGFGGPLISMALVSAVGDEWYEVLNVPKSPHPWVKKNVIPYLDKPAIPRARFRESLYLFLKSHQDETIYADWPEDFTHLMNTMCEPHGVSMNIPSLSLELVTLFKPESKRPHNALWDARALRDAHQAYIAGWSEHDKKNYRNDSQF